MRTDQIAAWAVAGALAVAAAQAETLFQQDGITVEGIARIVTRNAGACRVLEEHHSGGVFERMKANSGKPLHVWQVDFAVHNGSGRSLSHLRALFGIASEDPPCTNWSGPTGSYAKTVQWASSFEVLQKPSGMEPGEELSNTVFVLAFDDHQPRFDSWDVDYRFAAEPGGVGSGARADAPVRAGLRAGEAIVFDGIEFVWVPAGEFRMGSTSLEVPLRERPARQVRISEGFWLGRYEVTQAEWEAVMGSNPSHSDECGSNCPVEFVSWDEVQQFIQRLNEVGGEERYRLPTEAEWEYAARAGTSGDRYAEDLDAIAWYSGERMHPVGEKAENAWGLHDMLGNVYEWVQDWYGLYQGRYVTDPRGPGSGSARVHRGGSWLGRADYCRAPARFIDRSDYRDPGLGFRLLRIAP